MTDLTDEQLDQLKAAINGWRQVAHDYRYVDMVFAIDELLAARKTIKELREANREMVEQAKQWGEGTAKLKADNARLREIVDKLPKTADGVAVEPGDEVWYSPTSDGTLDEPATVFVGVMANIHAGIVVIDHCYSTREAAEAAKENTK